MNYTKKHFDKDINTVYFKKVWHEIFQWLATRFEFSNQQVFALCVSSGDEDQGLDQ